MTAPEEFPIDTGTVRIGGHVDPTALAIRDRLIEVLHRQTAQAEPIYEGPCRTCSERADEIIAELAAVLFPPRYIVGLPLADDVDLDQVFVHDPARLWLLPASSVESGSIHLAMPTGADLIAAERRRQVQVEGYTLEHDREHGAGKLYHAGWALELGNRGLWPRGWAWKPKNALRDLIRAGALYQASADVASEDWIRARATGARDQVARMIDDLLAEARTVLLGAGS